MKPLATATQFWVGQVNSRVGQRRCLHQDAKSLWRNNISQSATFNGHIVSAVASVADVAVTGVQEETDNAMVEHREGKARRLEMGEWMNSEGERWSDEEEDGRTRPWAPHILSTKTKFLLLTFSKL